MGTSVTPPTLQRMDKLGDSHVLAGGNSGSEVVRVGDTVRRQPGPWSASVDALLLHLEAVGFDGAPRALGYDELGRQVLSFIPGHVDASSGDLTESDVESVGRLVRELHDASSTFVWPAESVWNVAIPHDEAELICHNDLAPWNLVRGGGPFAFVDWDGAGPGSRLWDLAYAAHGFALASAREGVGDEEVGVRLSALVNGYGLDEVGREGLAPLLARRIRSMFELLESGKRSGVEPWAHLWDQGHGTIWHEDALYAEQHGPRWREALGLGDR